MSAGRPPLGGKGARTAMISFRAPEGTQELLRTVAASRGVEVSAVLREAVSQYLDTWMEKEL